MYNYLQPNNYDDTRADLHLIIIFMTVDARSVDHGSGSRFLSDITQGDSPLHAIGEGRFDATGGT